MGFELKRLVREAAGALGSRVAAKARAIGRRAHVHAERVWHDVGTMLHLEPPASATEGRRAQGATPAAAASCAGRAGDPAACEPNVALGPTTQVIVETMVEVLERSGYRELRADVAGLRAPDVVRGTVRSHRPNLAAVGGGCPVLVDVFVPEETTPDEQLSRWHLFSSAAEQTGGEFHVVVPTTIDGMPGRAWTARLAEAAGLSIQKVWEI